MITPIANARWRDAVLRVEVAAIVAVELVAIGHVLRPMVAAVRSIAP